MAQRVKLGGSTDHMIILPIDLEDGGDVIEVTMPLMNWMPRSAVNDYKQWIEHVTELGDKYDKWQKAVEEYEKSDPKPRKKPGDAPCDPDDLPTEPRLFQLRHLKPFCTDAEYKRIVENCSPGLANDIFQAILGAGEDDDEPEITEGESSASTGS
ncbi:hypothetical protein [Gordonia sp. (in: high G+C Gram-positive bacteria)]|uniref:hypothetical protein n=1 Tax=Gordonia sp. (in: high G+C Gram-positive bacteria) TaxID=84139 RepID=UPI003F995FE1